MSASKNLCVVEVRGGGGDACTRSLLSFVGQEELSLLRRQLEGKDGETRRPHDETGFKSIAMSSADSLERGGKSCRLEASLNLSKLRV